MPEKSATDSEFPGAVASVDAFRLIHSDVGSDDGRLVHLDKATGELTLKFRLPGF